MNVHHENQEVLDRAVNQFIEGLAQSDKSPSMGITFKSYLNAPFLLSASIQKGIPFSLFQKIRESAPFSDQEWSEFLHISANTLQQFAEENKTLNQAHSERILQVAEVSEKGKEVFGSWEKFHRWLQGPIMALGNRKPQEFLVDAYGKEILMKELGRIEHGIFA